MTFFEILYFSSLAELGLLPGMRGAVPWLLLAGFALLAMHSVIYDHKADTGRILLLAKRQSASLKDQVHPNKALLLFGACIMTGIRSKAQLAYTCPNAKFIKCR
jgi:hypothetical protein